MSCTSEFNYRESGLIASQVTIVTNFAWNFFFRAKIDLPENAFAKDGEEIIEELDEAKEQQWRLKHAESVRRQKQIEAEQREKAAKEDQNVLKLLDDLEKLEVAYDDTLDKLLPLSKTNVHANESNSSTVDSNNNDLIAKSNQEIVQLFKAYRGKIEDVLRNVRKDDDGSLNLYLDLIKLKKDIEDDIQKMTDGEKRNDVEDEDTIVSDSNDLTASANLGGQ